MIKVAVLDDYQDAFVQIIDISKYKDKFHFKIFNEAFNDENESTIRSRRRSLDCDEFFSHSFEPVRVRDFV